MICSPPYPPQKNILKLPGHPVQAQGLDFCGAPNPLRGPKGGFRTRSHAQIRLTGLGGSTGTRNGKLDLTSRRTGRRKPQIPTRITRCAAVVPQPALLFSSPRCCQTRRLRASLFSTASFVTVAESKAVGADYLPSPNFRVCRGTVGSQINPGRLMSMSSRWRRTKHNDRPNHRLGQSKTPFHRRGWSAGLQGGELLVISEGLQKRVFFARADRLIPARLTPPPPNLAGGSGVGLPRAKQPNPLSRRRQTMDPLHTGVFGPTDQRPRPGPVISKNR